MFCQKCRTPLKLDSSLEDLNPAAFDLLVASVSKAVPEQRPSANLSYPPERKDLYDRTSATSASPIYKRSIPAPRHGKSTDLSPYAPSRQEAKNNPDMSFIEITQSQIVPHQTPVQESPKARRSGQTAVQKIENESSDHTIPLSFEIERSQRLFAILSAHSDIDHPVCAECTSVLLAHLNSRLASSTRERDAYISFLKSLQSSSSSTIPSSEAATAAEEALAETLEKEKTSLEELKALETEKKALEAEIAELEEQSRALELEEQAFWSSRNSFDETLYDLSSNLSSLQKKQLHDQQQLQRLQRTNVFNDTFNIGHDGFFGTINGLRLGRLPNQNVEWSEINAAWGQTLLLLATVAERLGYTFQGYRLRPMGSTSRIEKVEWPQQMPDSNARSHGGAVPSPQRQVQHPATVAPKVTPLDLFSSGDIALGRVFYHRRFDGGMVAFLDCLSQLGTFLEKTSPAATDGRPNTSRTNSSRSVASRGRVLPYSISGDKIGDVPTGQAVSIKLGAGFNQDESWTKACKYALTCCKYLLAHVSNMGVSKDGRA